MAKWSRPLLFHSKLLCLSLLYLATTTSLTVYVSLSQKGCFFRSPPSNSNHHHPLFSYPKTYGEHKYAIPTARSSCHSPVLFPDYRVAFEEIRDLSRNSSHSSPLLRYLQAPKDAATFAGNFSIRERKSFFNHSDERTEVPCGFLTEFPVKKSDRMAMEKCKGVVVVSAIMGDHDKIRQPKGLGARTLQTACFFMFIDDSTLRGLNSHSILLRSAADDHHNKIGAWRIVRVWGRDQQPYTDAAMNGVIPKHLLHRLFPNAKFSIWVDAKMQLTVDPLLLIHSLLISKGADMALSKHPFNIHTMQEAMATARWKKWADVDSLRMQMEAYCENGLQPWTHDKLPYTTDVPDTALILRRHGLGSNLFSCLLFNELEAFNPRDQLAFAYVRDLMSPKTRIHMFEVEAFEQVTVEYRHNLKRDGGSPGGSTLKKSIFKRASSRGINGSSCQGYLLRMWGEEF